MDGYFIIDKPKDYTSRDVVNVVSKKLNTKKVGHTGTLDPLATGVLVVLCGKATKLAFDLTSSYKEYIADVKLGILTDTLDTTGIIIKEEKCIINKEELVKVLNSFVGKYLQQVPIYSAVKVNGKKLYEYARENKEVVLPKREVEVKKIDLISIDDNFYRFKVKVSKGTYIRSLINDINSKLGVIGVMSNLRRISQGDFKIDVSIKLKDLSKDKIMPIDDLVYDIKKVNVSENLYDKIKNGALVKNIFNDNKIRFYYKEKLIAIYKIYDKDKSMLKPYKMFI